MPPFDATARAALAGSVVQPSYFAYLDIVGQPFRVTTANADVTFSATGDADLDGQTFSAISPEVVEVGDVVHSEGGSETLNCSLSGLLNGDLDTLNTIGNKASWQGRKARLWVWIHDENGTAQGAIAPYYTGYMVAIEIQPSPDSQVIRLQIENYLAALNEASQRTYLGQKTFDATDLSPQAILAAVNGARRGPASGLGFGGGGGGGGGSRGGGGVDRQDVRLL